VTDRMPTQMGRRILEELTRARSAAVIAERLQVDAEVVTAALLDMRGGGLVTYMEWEIRAEERRMSATAAIGSGPLASTQPPNAVPQRSAPGSFSLQAHHGNRLSCSDCFLLVAARLNHMCACTKSTSWPVE